MIHPDVQKRLEAAVGSVTNVLQVGGGCISNACRVETGDQVFFVKWSDAGAGRTFEAESRGLTTLREANSELVIPQVFVARNATKAGRPGFIAMEWIAQGRKKRDFWSQLGVALASLHRNVGPSFGFVSDNFIGQVEQVNETSDDWVDFFRRHRLEFQRDLARSQGRWQREWDDHFDRLSARLREIIPGRPPVSLVHGDLWSGNVLATAAGTPCLIDPAVHYADREVDLAMSELFGGFPEPFYEAYQEAWGLEPGYPERRDVYNLYHLINHLNHFGMSYAGRVDSILKAF